MFGLKSNVECYCELPISDKKESHSLILKNEAAVLPQVGLATQFLKTNHAKAEMY
jgi:hypothetical protein